MGFLGWCVKETDAAIHSLTCGVPDRQSNEIRYLKQATELMEEWQKLLQGVPPVTAQTSDLEEVNAGGEAAVEYRRAFLAVLRKIIKWRTLPYGPVM